MKKTLPTINKKQNLSKSRFFNVEQLDLTFSNGEQREYERMSSASHGAVLILPMLDDETLLLVREYCAGTHSYELGFPKGLIDAGESASEAANRELKEEVGFGAKQLTHLQQVSMAPAFFNSKMDLFIAKDLYPEKLVGDEPEILEVVHWKIADYKQLLQQDDFNEARSVAALMLLVDEYRGG